MYLTKLNMNEHPLFKNLKIDLNNPKKNMPYSIIAFVGENGCGKTSILNEISNYINSRYIKDKELDINDTFSVLYMRQGALWVNARNEIFKLITGETFYSEDKEYSSVKYFNQTVDFKKKLISSVEWLDDKQIIGLIQGNHLNSLHCSQTLSSKIDGQEHTYIIDNFSSGQQEILLKLQAIMNSSINLDCVLIDEPESSLHPRWQLKIIDTLLSILTNADGKKPQLFIATHSEKILESLLNNEDALIIRLFNENNEIKYESINQMNLFLLKPTIAEMDYIIFHIASFEYHNQLFDYYSYLIKKENICRIDSYIENDILSMHNEDISQYYKIMKYGKIVYKMLPTYIRNYYHHPNKITAPSNQELERSIQIMQRIIQLVKTNS